MKKKIKRIKQPQYLKYHKDLSQEKRMFFLKRGLKDKILNKLKIGYDKESKHYTFPYFNESGKCTFIKYISSDKKHFWKPNNSTELRIFNFSDISKAKKNHATLYITEGEKDCLILKQAGYYCIGISGVNGFKKEYVELFEDVKEVIICFDNDTPGEEGSQKICNLLSFKAKALIWPKGLKEGYDINDLYLDQQEEFNEYFDKLVEESIRQYRPIFLPIIDRKEDFKAILKGNHSGISTGYKRLDKFISGLNGITFLGGEPKIGKSMFALNIAINAAKNEHPVIYCDFENGFFKVMTRILSNIHDVNITKSLRENITDSEIFDKLSSFGKNLFYYRPSPTSILNSYHNDDQRNIENFFEQIHKTILQEFKLEKQILIIIDSLQKLPLLSLSERRSGIDQWLRGFESAKEEYNMAFLLVSELKRGTYNQERMDSFKESGDIEYTADLALLLVGTKDMGKKKLLKLVAIANRDGERGTIACYKPKYNICKFEESKLFISEN